MHFALWQIVSIVAACGVLGAVLRHLQGGLDAAFKMHRWQEVAGYTFISVPVLFHYWSSTAWGPYHAHALGLGFIFAAMFDLDMVLGQDFNKPWKVLLRFGAAPLLISFLTQFWWVAGVGAVLALGTALLRNKRVKLFAPYIDGWEAYWELMIGGATASAWATAGLFGIT